MIARKLSPPTIRLEGATVSISAKFTSRVAGVATEAAYGFQKSCEAMTSGQLVAGLNMLHRHARELAELVPQVERIAGELEDAARVLDTGIATETGPLVDVALAARAQADAALLTDPGLELADVAETARVLRSTAKLLREDATAARRKADSLTDLHQRCTAKAIACPASDPIAIADRFKVPADLRAALDAALARGDAPARHAADDWLRGQAGDDKRAKRARQARALAEVTTAAAQIWEGAAS
ncbi:hypothetical protein [Paracoccus sp. PAR01]|uniref:hypothetical protein n=1 Tax=Paracoccus sp. PAR01 TaxID=2769282 RepID=UPI00177F66C5|nr:hypothetical protein [Paracoccus sp. PAR01]MBD9527834.1 hypothetical protein [Paracoccus sp. PAR01]